MSNYLPRRPDVGGLAITIAIHAGLAAALLLLVDRVVRPAPPPPPIIVSQVPTPPAPPRVEQPVTHDIRIEPDVRAPVWDEPLSPPAVDAGFGEPLLPPDGGIAAGDRLAEPPPIRVAGPSRAPRLVAGAAAQPPYPPVSRRLGEQGIVVLAISVGADGTVSDVRLVTSSGFPRLDQAALDQARRRWRFEPALQDGRPVAAVRTITVTFRLADG